METIEKITFASVDNLIDLLKRTGLWDIEKNNFMDDVLTRYKSALLHQQTLNDMIQTSL